MAYLDENMATEQATPDVRCTPSSLLVVEERRPLFCNTLPAITSLLKLGNGPGSVHVSGGYQRGGWRTYLGFPRMHPSVAEGLGIMR